MHVRPVVYGTNPPFLLACREDRTTLTHFLKRHGVASDVTPEDDQLTRIICRDTPRHALASLLEEWLGDRSRHQVSCAPGRGACLSPPGTALAP